MYNRPSGYCFPKTIKSYSQHPECCWGCVAESSPWGSRVVKRFDAKGKQQWKSEQELGRSTSPSTTSSSNNYARQGVLKHPVAWRRLENSNWAALCARLQNMMSHLAPCPLALWWFRCGNTRLSSTRQVPCAFCRTAYALFVLQKGWGKREARLVTKASRTRLRQE